MEVLFANHRLARDLGQAAGRARRFGVKAAQRIDLRLQQLVAARTLADLRHLPGRCHELKGARKGLLAIDVTQPYRLLFRPSAEPAPELTSGGLDWRAVESVTITEIVDYH